MGIVKTKGIVINIAQSKDNDKILTVLTPDLGKISVLVKGARKLNSTFLSVCQLLAFSDLVLYRNLGELYILNSAEIIEIFYNIRIDIEKYYYCTYICKLTCDVSNDNDNSYELLQLLLNTIFLYSAGEKDNMFLVTTFQIRLLRVLGFMPILDKCSMCGEKELDSFSIKYNGLICKQCAKQETGAIHFSISMINAVKYIIYSESKKVFSFKISKEVLAELKLFIKIYLREKIDKEYDIDKYIKDVLI